MNIKLFRQHFLKFFSELRIAMLTLQTMRCLEMSRNVERYMSRAHLFNIPEDVVVSTLKKMAIVLKSSGRWAEAAKALEVAVRLTHCRIVSEKLQKRVSTSIMFCDVFKFVCVACAGALT